MREQRQINYNVKGSGQECPLHTLVPEFGRRKGLRWLALQVQVTNGHCGCTKVTNIIFEHHL